jgi:tetratricopeptide (TPR) repeat protein
MMRSSSLVHLLALCGVTTAVAQQDSVRARDAYMQGRSAVQQRKIDDAVKLLERAVMLDADNYEYRMWLGHAYSRQIASVNFMKKAVVARKAGAEYNKAVELAPTSIDAAEARLEFFMEAPGMVGGGTDKARAEAARIATLSKYRGRLAAAKLAAHEKDFAGAEREYRALVTQYPDSGSAVVALATFLQTHNRFDDAFDVVDRRLARVPDDTSAIYQLGRVAALSGQRLTAGEAALRRFLSMVAGKDTLNRANAHYRLGMIREKMGDTASARAEYASALKLFPALEAASNALKKLSRR